MPRPTLYYVRHGLTDWNMQGRLQGRQDTPLNATGQQQAKRCGEILHDLFARDGRSAADFGYASSPLLRARATMDILRATLALAPAGYGLDERLSEIAFGEWEGLTYNDILARDREIVETREHNKWLFRPPGGETYEEVARRAIAFLGVAAPDEAVHHTIDQGVVYVFADRSVAKYE
jgi:broad specificity phosphatase PhoE